jgi:hypothetical protein
MKQKIAYSLVPFCSACLFSVGMAQSPQTRPGDLLPRELYIEKHLGNVQQPVPAKLFEYRILPLDNMVCAVPMISKGGINVIDFNKSAAYPSVIIPNTLSKQVMVK